MAQKVSAIRNYRSPLRERQVAQTREMIIRGLATEIVENGLHDLSMATVAARAEVAERTVYRHFTGIDDMIEALRAFVGEQIVTRMADLPRVRPDKVESPDDLAATLPALYATFDAIGDPARAMAIITLTQGSDNSRQRRRESLRRALQADLAHLDDTTADAVFETIYTIAGSQTWFLITRDGRLTSEQAGEGAAHVMRALLAGLRSQQAAARPRARVARRRKA